MTHTRPSSFIAFTVLTSICAAAPAAEKPAAPALTEKIDRAIEKVRTRPLRADRDTPWVVMHAVIAFEQQVKVSDGDADVPGVEYLCQRATYEGKPIFRVENGLPALPTRGLRYGLKQSFIVQDHVDQFLMAFADADVPTTQKIKADDGTAFSVADMVDAMQKRFTPDQELAWTLVAATHYLGIEKAWTGADGKRYTVADLLVLAVKQDASRQTEGGPHHLYGIAYALAAYRAAGGQLQGVWAEAADYLKRHVDIAKQFQLEDGSFSVRMFRRQLPAPNAKTLVWATGHQIEWMTLALPPEQLREPWMQKAVGKLADVLLAEDTESLSMGGLYHAGHALRRYREATAP